MRDWRKNERDMPIYGAACFSVSRRCLDGLPDGINGVLSGTFVPLLASWSTSGIFGHHYASEQVERLGRFGQNWLTRCAKRLVQRKKLSGGFI